MGDEVTQGGGCGINELQPKVVTEVYEVTGLANIVGCGARSVDLRCQGSRPSL